MSIINAQFLYQALASALYARDKGDISNADRELEQVENIIKGCEGLTFGGNVDSQSRAQPKLYREVEGELLEEIKRLRMEVGSLRSELRSVDFGGSVGKP